MRFRPTGGWSLVRWFRLGIGILITIQGLVHRDGVAAAMGGLLILLPLYNIGCCGGGSCSLPRQKHGMQPRANRKPNTP